MYNKIVIELLFVGDFQGTEYFDFVVFVVYFSG